MAVEIERFVAQPARLVLGEGDQAAPQAPALMVGMDGDIVEQQAAGLGDQNQDAGEPPGSFENKHQLVVDDSTPLDDARRTVVIRVQNEAGEDKAAFEVFKAWPCKYDPSDLNGKGNEVAIDTLELCNEGIRRIQ